MAANNGWGTSAREVTPCNSMHVLAIGGLALCATGCFSALGPQSVRNDRPLYAASLSDSWNEQTLLNIVKIRYVDPPVFVDVGQIVSSHSLQEGVTVTGNIVPNGSVPNATIGGSGTYTNTPTVTYIPLTGNKFIRGLATPLPLEAVFAGMQGGLPADVVLFASVASINDLKNQEATRNGMVPGDPAFHRVRALAREIQLSGQIRFLIKKDAKGELVTVLRFHAGNISPQIQSDIAEMRHLLGLNPNANEIQVVPGAVPANDTEVAMTTRSILDLMEAMAAQVEVPTEDLAKSRAFPGFEHDRDVSGVVRQIRIHSGESRPPDAFVSVKYRNSWFWIDDSDLESKHVFSLIMNLFTMVDTGSPQNQPVVTIPSR
jgi:hypothetical protein